MKTGNFWCINCTCGAKNKDRDFQIEISTKDNVNKMLCPIDNESYLKLMGYKVEGGINTGQFKKGRPKKEREKRRIDDFKKNTLPKLTGSDRAYFEKKYGKV